MTTPTAGTDWKSGSIRAGRRVGKGAPSRRARQFGVRGENGGHVAGRIRAPAPLPTLRLAPFLRHRAKLRGDRLADRGGRAREARRGGGLYDAIHIDED